ncbi:hypothetical protein SEA_BILLNYE_230 [Streptomyces phage BillNye]|uniref:Uncharacterized protein n=1 Tax=Streptomyces phage BillNye TaxID=2079426 RepID=A0A2L1IW39_9CAUD|nr:hypothetical protein FDJ30_gp032 [Streptomyces phage BillNye]AVD99401.1 hypothetical protein SEA_BILLNYE_230 [Streptomyces phage BillNye]
MDSTRGLRLHATDHALKQILQKGFAVEKIRETFENPVKLYKNGKYEGQYRVTGNGICLVGKPKGNTFTLITVYEDGVMTPPRPDQLETEEGRAYAERYAEGLARDNEYMPRAIARERAQRKAQRAA